MEKEAEWLHFFLEDCIQEFCEERPLKVLFGIAHYENMLEIDLGGKIVEVEGIKVKVFAFEKMKVVIMGYIRPDIKYKHRVLV